MAAIPGVCAPPGPGWLAGRLGPVSPTGPRSASGAWLALPKTPQGEVARLVAGAARLAGVEDLAQAAAPAGGDGAGTEDARALYDFGYACMERGVGYLAVRPLARALELATDAAPVLSELVAALEQDGQHARAVAVLEEHESVMRRLALTDI